MTEPDEKETLRRARISNARKGRAIGGDAGVASRLARQAKAQAFADTIVPVIKEISATIHSHTGIAAELNRRGFVAPRGGPWSAKQVERLWQRISE